MSLGSGLIGSTQNPSATGGGGGGSGTVTNVATGTGLTGGPITSTGTISQIAKSVNQLVSVNNSSTAVGLEPTLNFTASGNVNLSVTINPGPSSVYLCLSVPSDADTSGPVTSVPPGTGLTGGPITTTGTIS